MNNINRKIHFGDNLNILEKEYSDIRFNLIYLDPPFNTNRNYNEICAGSKAQIDAFEDTWKWAADSDKEFNKLISNSRISSLMSGLNTILTKESKLAYLTYMATRLLKLYDVLDDNGSLYLHCDSTMSYYLRCVLDGIFGENNFRNEIVWHYTKMDGSERNLIRNHDTIFFYSKSSIYTFNKIYLNETSALYERLGHLRDIDDNTLKYRDAKTLNQLLLDSYIRAAKRKLNKEKLDDNDIIIDFKTKGRRKADDVWYIPHIKGNSKENLNLDTQKPRELLKNIIEISTNEGDLILDPFAGTGTTASAAEELNRRWVMIDISTPMSFKIKNRLTTEFSSKYILNHTQPEIDGIPKDIEGAKILWDNDPYSFQCWCCELIGAAPGKKGKDRGSDGHILFEDENKNYKRLIVQVKGGKNISPTDIRDLRGTIISKDAVGGIYITLYPPTRDMISESNKYGMYKCYNRDIQTIQIVMVEDLLNNKKPDIPHTQIPHRKGASEIILIKKHNQTIYDDLSDFGKEKTKSAISPFKNSVVL